MSKNTKEKICAFYASDYHFEMISLPYIDKKIENNEEIIILTENNLNATIKTLLDKTNLKKEKKEQILELDWINNDFEKFKKIKSKINEKKNITVFIKGKENYIHNVNQNIEKWIEKGNVKIIDCYDVNEIGDNLNTIIRNYNKVLKTAGEENIE